VGTLRAPGSGRGPRGRPVRRSRGRSRSRRRRRTVRGRASRTVHRARRYRRTARGCRTAISRPALVYLRPVGEAATVFEADPVHVPSEFVGHLASPSVWIRRAGPLRRRNRPGGPSVGRGRLDRLASAILDDFGQVAGVDVVDKAVDIGVPRRAQGLADQPVGGGQPARFSAVSISGA
jgi:hypothetical protein